MAKKPITSKQLTILFLLYRFRFLNRLQIQLLLNHKTPNRINPWLKHLTVNGFIGRHYLKTYGENNKLAIYHLKTPSKRILENKPGIINQQLIKIYKEDTRSEVFRDTCIAVGDCYLYFLAFSKSLNNTLNFYTKADQSEFTYLPRTISGVFLSLTGKTETKYYFLESLDARMPKRQQKGMIDMYLKYYDQGVWQEEKKDYFPGIFIVCCDEKVQRSIRRFIKEKLEESNAEINFYTTLQKNITYIADIPNIWKKVEQGE